MKWVHSTLLAATVVVGSLVGPRAQPAQSSSVPCLCKGSSVATVFAHPCIELVGHSGSVKDGRCHKPPPSSCILQAKSCHAYLAWTVQAKDGCLPTFEWAVDGVVQPEGGQTQLFSAHYEDDLPCATSKIVVIRANGERVLEYVVACSDCG